MNLKACAQEVLNLINRGTYSVDGNEISVEDQIKKSLVESRLYTPNELEDLCRGLPEGSPAQIEVRNGTTQQLAKEISSEGPVVLLNFASARNPGGGFMNGAKAQEEDLCRCSALYPTLLKHSTYYEANRKQNSKLYTDHAIFSPEVPFFKIRGTGDFLPEPFFASVITMPAPNSKPFYREHGNAAKLKRCFERRWRCVLAIARDAGIPNVLLGAWGCGAFGGDPMVASETAQIALKDYASAFERVVFAIPGTGKRSKLNLEVFQETFRQ